MKKDFNVERLLELVDRDPSLPWIVNARGKADGPPYEVWHTAGPGGKVGEFTELGDAILCTVAVEMLLRRKHCACDDPGEGPCPKHWRENMLQDRVAKLEAALRRASVEVDDDE